MKWLREQTMWPSEGMVGQKCWDWRLSWYWSVSWIFQPVDVCWLLVISEFNLIDGCSIEVRELEKWTIDQCQKTLRRAWKIVFPWSKKWRRCWLWQSVQGPSLAMPHLPVSLWPLSISLWRHAQRPMKDADALNCHLVSNTFAFISGSGFVSFGSSSDTVAG